jgi:hypothetical protein
MAAQGGRNMQEYSYAMQEALDHLIAASRRGVETFEAVAAAISDDLLLSGSVQCDMYRSQFRNFLDQEEASVARDGRARVRRRIWEHVC